MHTFRYFPPSPEEQRGFFMQLLGTLLGLLVIGVLVWRSDDVRLRAVMIGAGIGALYLMVRGVWQLEIKARRAQNAQIGVDESGLHVTDDHGQLQDVRWDEIESTEVLGGKLLVRWPRGELKVGAREIENGMEAIRLIAARGQSTPTPATPSNFIPLEPKA